MPVDPKVIAVANAQASRIFEDKFKAVFDEKKGYHTIQLNHQTIPVFLGSMYYGQRAMDNYSFHYLKWHIKQALNQSN